MADWIEQEAKKRELQGVLKYGPISPQTDKRCFRKEAIEELLDAFNYIQWAREKGELNRQQWRHLDNIVRICLTTLERVCESKRFLSIDYEYFGEMLGRR